MKARVSRQATTARTAAALALVASPWIPTAGAQATPYSARFVGTGSPVAVNDLGKVCGNEGGRAWFADVSGGPVQLPLPGTATGSTARDLNDLGWVVGQVSGPGSFDAVIWKPNGPSTSGSWTVEVIATPTGTDSEATAVNDLGDVIGTFVGGGGFYYNASEGFVPFNSLVPAGQAPWPADINDQRLVAGRDFFGQAATLDLAAGTWTTLGLPTGTGTNYMAVDVYGVNDRGDMACRGVVATALPDDEQAVRYDASTGTWLALTLPMPFGYAIDLDSSGNTLFHLGFSSPVYVYFHGLGSFDVQTLLEPGSSGWSIGNGRDISDDGRIVCTGTNSGTGESGVVVLTPSSGPVTYCTAGASASGCAAVLGASGTASASASSGFVVTATGVEGAKAGLFFFGANGRQAAPWGNGSSYQCVVPPVKRTPLQSGTGTDGLCDGGFALDLNALWCPSCPRPGKNPGAGAEVQAQLWYRDPKNTSNQTTSLSDAVEFTVLP